METSQLALIEILKNIQGVNYEYAVEAIGGSFSLYEKALKQSIKYIPTHIEKMKQYFINDKNLDALAIEAHGLKGSLRQIGYIRLSREAEELEMYAKSKNLTYCEQHFNEFVEELLRFHDKVEGVLHSIQLNESNNAEIKIYSIIDFYDELEKAQTAADDYDSISTVDILTPLAKYRFDDTINELLSSAIDALEMFQPQKAAKYISELIKQCNMP